MLNFRLNSTKQNAAEKLSIVRNIERLRTDDYLNRLFTDFFEQKGDHCLGEDSSIIGGIARFHGRPVTVVGERRGHSLSENIACNFGMPRPAGYRKALRIMQEADKFGRPVITFIDTPGAYPGVEAERHGQASAIAENLAGMINFSVPVISVVIGEGNSGGALAIGVANEILMLENAVYSVLSPEGFATIIWKDKDRRDEACELMKFTARDLYRAGVADRIIREPSGGTQNDLTASFTSVDRALTDSLRRFGSMTPDEIRAQRYEKYRRIGMNRMRG